MKRILSILTLCAVALWSLSCHGYVDPEGTGDDVVLPEGVDTTVNLASGYAGKMIAMQFTSIGCTYCPILADALKDVQANRPGEIIPVAFHLNFGGYVDPMTLPINVKLFEKLNTGKGDGLPLFALNFKKSSQHIVNEYAKIISEMDIHAAANPVVCGVAVSTEYDAAARSVQINAKITSDVARQYRYHIFLVEDGIDFAQAGVDGDSYTHNNVLRAMTADNILGAKLNAGEYLEPGKEYEVSKTIALAQEWNAENMRVVVIALNSRDGGKNFYANNAVECALGKSVDYAFEGDVPFVESKFQRHVCVMEFTGTWCAQCPSGAVTLNYLVDRAYKGKAFALAFHNNDIYALPQEQELMGIFKWTGYPAYVTDMDQNKVGLLNEGGCGSTIESSLYDSMTHCGAAVTCTYDETSRKVTVDAKMFSELTMNYRIAAYVVEDKVIGEQTQSTGEVDKDYSHRHMVRQMLSSNVRGDNLFEVQSGREAQKSYVFNVSDDWKLENLSVAVLILDDKGRVNNMAICAADGGVMDYEYLN